jgi:hypothetical protein
LIDNVANKQLLIINNINIISLSALLCCHPWSYL